MWNGVDRSQAKEAQATLRKAQVGAHQAVKTEKSHNSSSDSAEVTCVHA